MLGGSLELTSFQFPVVADLNDCGFILCSLSDTKNKSFQSEMQLFSEIPKKNQKLFPHALFWASCYKMFMQRKKKSLYENMAYSKNLI